MYPRHNIIFGFPGGFTYGASDLPIATLNIDNEEWPTAYFTSPFICMLEIVAHGHNKRLRPDIQGFNLPLDILGNCRSKFYFGAFLISGENRY